MADPILETEDEVLKEMYGGSIPRVDLVSGPATGLFFTVIKAGAEQDPTAVWKAKYDAETQRRMLADGEAFKGPDGEPSYPIGDKADLERAVHAVGRGNEDHDAIRRYIIRRAKALGAESDIPADWAADGSLKESTVTKAAEPTEQTVTKAADEAALPDADELMGEAEAGAAGSPVPTDAAGDPDDPESPAWEAVDAARARQAVNMVVALQRLVGESLARETQEAAVGADVEDDDNAFDLSCVLDALDCVLDTLAPFAVGEQAESEAREADAVSVVTKAGRVLSSANEERIQAAVKSLQSVLASLPAATEPEGGPVAETDTEPVAKASDKTLMAVYSQAGKLLGVVDPTKITEVATGDEGDSDEASDSDSGEAPPDDDTAAPAAPAADGTEAAPAADEAAPAAPAAPAADDTDEAPVAKSQDVAEVVEAAVTKALRSEREQHEAVLKALEERLAAVEAQPMPGGPLLSGAPNAGTPYLRGQDLGAQGSQIETVRKAMEAETDPVKQADLSRQLTFLTLRAAYSG